MIFEEYVTFKDDDQILGVWYVGTLAHHMYAAAVLDPKYKTVKFDVKLEVQKKNPQYAEVSDLALKMLTSIPWPLMTFTDPENPDFSEAHDRIHQILYPMADIFINIGGAGGALILRPGTGKELKEKLANQPWDKLLGTETAAKVSN